MTHYDAVLVGGGPRGVATVLRVAARAGDAAPVRLAIVDAVEIGGGATWRTDQPAAYLNNTTVAATTVHPDESTRMTGPPAPGPHLTDWVEQVRAAGSHPFADWVAEEVRGLRPHDFPTRRLQGVYYRDQLDAAIAGGRVVVDEVLGTVVDLAAADGLTRVVLSDGRELAAPTVVLAQGMVQARPDPQVAALTAAADRLGLRYVPPGMPAERDFSGLPAGEPVLVRGLGANFFDVVGGLLDEWGGSFAPVEGDPHGRLRYTPSGREPVLVAGSRRGMLYRSKPDGDAPLFPFRPRWATPEWFAAQRERRGVDFATEVWPVIAKDLAAAHLDALALWRDGAVRGGWEAALDAARTPADIDAVLRAHVRDERHLFTLDMLRRPSEGRPLTPEAWRQFLARWIEDELASMSEPWHHPRAAVNQAMGALRGPAAGLAVAGALTGTSTVHDLQGWFDAVGLSLASGPPSHRVRVVLALIEAGVLRILGPELSVTVDDERGFVARSAITGEEVASRVLLETRMSKGKVPDTDDPLLRNLLDSGRARIHRFDGVDSTSMETTPAVVDEDEPHGFNLVAADGSVDHGVVVLGIPALATQPGSAIGATPGKPSPLLAGADIAAKQILLRRSRVSAGTARAAAAS